MIMKRSLSLLLAVATCSTLAGCWWDTPASDDGTVSSSSSSQSSVQTRPVTYEGLLQRTGVGRVTGGTHFLALVQGGVIALTSDTLPLDAYVDEMIKVDGAERQSAEGYPLVNVTKLEVVPQDLPLIESSSSAMSSSSLSSSEQAVSSAAASSSVAPPPPARSSAAPIVMPVASSSKAAVSSVAPAPVPAASSAAASSVSADEAMQRRTQLMVKANMSASSFTQTYCSTHVGFCIPVHKNWYYVSFGANTTALWRLEVSAEEIENVGDGVIVVTLVNGPIGGNDGSVTTSSTEAVGLRAWTGGRHFQIRGPIALRAAIEVMTQGLSTGATATQ